MSAPVVQRPAWPSSSDAEDHRAGAARQRRPRSSSTWPCGWARRLLETEGWCLAVRRRADGRPLSRARRCIEPLSPTAGCAHPAHVVGAAPHRTDLPPMMAARTPHEPVYARHDSAVDRRHARAPPRPDHAPLGHHRHRAGDAPEGLQVRPRPPAEGPRLPVLSGARAAHPAGHRHRARRGAAPTARTGSVRVVPNKFPALRIEGQTREAAGRRLRPHERHRGPRGHHREPGSRLQTPPAPTGAPRSRPSRSTGTA
jgi:hypothetical protein